MTPWTVAHQASLSMEFSWQEYWSGLPCPPPRDLPSPRAEPASPALQADFLPLSHWENPIFTLCGYVCIYMCVCVCVCVCVASLGAKLVKNLPVMQEIPFRLLG